MPVCCTDSGLLRSNKVRRWVVSLARNPKFVDRQNEITKLEVLITTRAWSRRVAITGFGGAGKTQAALELAHCIRDRVKECSVLCG
ncbi:hypothetical protein BDW68DRAFT_171114 [Aspergillus falconensis]